jgi:hypothetical protein
MAYIRLRSQMFLGLNALTLALCIVEAGCKAPQTIGDATILSRQLRAEYHRPAAVTLDGRLRLIVTLAADSADTTGADPDSTGPAAQAYRVARFVGTHYDHAGTLKALTVIVEPADGDSAEGPTISTFSPGEFAPGSVAPGKPGTKSD